MKVQVKVKPNSKTDELVQEGDSFIARVKEPPKEGKANQAVIKLLAQYFGISLSQVRITSGFNSRNKVIEISDR